VIRTVRYAAIVEAVEGLVEEANYHLPGDVLDRIKSFRRRETLPRAAAVLDQIVENARIASTEELPLCQDTGTAVFFVDIGERAHVASPGLEEAIQEGTRRGYEAGKLRMSIVRDPLRRENTGDNTPAVIHLRIVSGDRVRITFCPKGGGCENMSRLAMLTSGQGRAGIVDFVVETVRIGGGKPCPPLVVGVGIGGNFETAPLIAKRALLRTIGERNVDRYYSDLEEELLETVNALGIGPMGLGGLTTALDVFVDAAPCHIASMPVAVNIQCHSARHKTVII